MYWKGSMEPIKFLYLALTLHKLGYFSFLKEVWNNLLIKNPIDVPSNRE